MQHSIDINNCNNWKSEIETELCYLDGKEHMQESLVTIITSVSLLSYYFTCQKIKNY